MYILREKVSRKYRTKFYYYIMLSFQEGRIKRINDFFYEFMLAHIHGVYFKKYSLYYILHHSIHSRFLVFFSCCDRQIFTGKLLVTHKLFYFTI